MNIFQKIFNSLAGKALITPPSGGFVPAGRLAAVNNIITWTPDNFNSYIVNGYAANDIIYSIVNMIMEKIKIAPWGLYQVVDEAALKRYEGLLRAKDFNFKEAQSLRHKALEPITNLNLQTGRLAELLQWPNEEDTFNELVAGISGYINITGNNYLWGDLLAGGANQGLPYELWYAPAQYMGIKASTGWPQKKTGYILNSPFYASFSTAEIMHEKLFNPLAGANGVGLYGMSPIKAALRTLTRNNAAKKAGATQLDNNGGAGIAFINEDEKTSLPEKKKQVGLIKEIWNNEYSGAENYGKVAFSALKMGYQAVGMSLKEMALTEVEAVDLRVLANVWGLPSQLLNDPANKTYNNAREAEKALTSRGALPRLTSTRNNLNRKFQTDWGFKGKNVYVDFDMNVYPELQENLGEKWAWLKDMPLPLKTKIEAMGFDLPDDPDNMLDTILVGNQMVPLADVIGGMTESQVNDMNDILKREGFSDYLRVSK